MVGGRREGAFRRPEFDVRSDCSIVQLLYGPKVIGGSRALVQMQCRAQLTEQAGGQVDRLVKHNPLDGLEAGRLSDATCNFNS